MVHRRRNAGAQPQTQGLCGRAAGGWASAPYGAGVPREADVPQEASVPREADVPQEASVPREAFELPLSAINRLFQNRGHRLECRALDCTTGEIPRRWYLNRVTFCRTQWQYPLHRA